MASSSEKNLLIKNNNIYIIENGRADFPADFGQAGSYTLFLEDSMFFYLSMDLPSTNRKKAKGFIANYLSTLFPEFMTENFGFILKNNTALIYLPSHELKPFLDQNMELLKKASKITTPFVETFLRESSFDYSDGKKFYSVSSNEILQMPEEPEGSLSAEKVLNKIIPAKASMSINGVEKESFLPSAYKLPLIVLAVCYLVFIGGEYLRLKGFSESFKQRETRLQELYKLAGVSTSSDPYGALLYKARGSNSAQAGVNVLSIIEQLSKAVDKQNISLLDLNIRETSINCTGTATDFQTIEDFKHRLESLGAKKVTIEDTDKQEDKVKFSVRFGI